jgi:hypothetical protein
VLSSNGTRRFCCLLADADAMNIKCNPTRIAIIFARLAFNCAHLDLPPPNCTSCRGDRVYQRSLLGGKGRGPMLFFTSTPATSTDKGGCSENPVTLLVHMQAYSFSCVQCRYSSGHVACVTLNGRSARALDQLQEPYTSVSAVETRRTETLICT